MRLTTAGRARRGFTLMEMLIAVTLLAVVAGGVLGVLRRQQRFYRGARDQLATRSNLRMALGLMPSDLRGVSSVGNDIYLMNDRRIEFRATFGSSLICTIPVAGGNSIVIPPRTLARDGELTTWNRTPEVGDSLLIYDNNTAVGDADDTWRVYRVNAILPLVGGCPTTTGFTTVADAAQSAYQITLNGNVTNTMAIGAPVRFFRKTVYQLYQASNQKWYLGWQDCLDTRAVACSAVQPISGPYKSAVTTAGQSGLTLTYYDSLNAVTAVPARVSRIEVVVRADENATTDDRKSYTAGKKDTLNTMIGLRNRS